MASLPALKYLEENHKRFRSELIELLRIPSISHDPHYKTEMHNAAHWLAEKFRAVGINNVEVMPTAGHPVVYGEWLNGGAAAPRVLIYGHEEGHDCPRSFFPQPDESIRSLIRRKAFFIGECCDFASTWN